MFTYCFTHFICKYCILVNAIPTLLILIFIYFLIPFTDLIRYEGKTQMQTTSNEQWFNNSTGAGNRQVKAGRGQ
jgi:hypothetical protein